MFRSGKSRSPRASSKSQLLDSGPEFGGSRSSNIGSDGSSKSGGCGTTILIVVAVFLLFMLLFGCWGTCTRSGKSTFKNIKERMTKGSDKVTTKDDTDELKNMGIIMFMNPNCGYCKQMLQLLGKKKHEITIVDVSTEQGKIIAKQYSVHEKPVPSFISLKNGTGTIGSKESIAELAKALMPVEKAQSGDVEELGILLFTRDGCSWCTKAKEMLKEEGLENIIKIVDIQTSEGKNIASEYLKNADVVPAWVSVKTKKSTLGYKVINEVIDQLK